MNQPLKRQTSDPRRPKAEAVNQPLKESEKMIRDTDHFLKILSALQNLERVFLVADAKFLGAREAP